MPQNDLADKINAMGANTIMGSIESSLSKSAETINNAAENTAEQSAADTAIDKITAQVLARNMKKRPIVKDHKIGRNDPCPCGKTINGKPVKYKNCCLKTGEYENYTRI